MPRLMLMTVVGVAAILSPWRAEAEPGQAGEIYVSTAQETRVALDVNVTLHSALLPTGTVLLPVALEGQWLVHRNIALDFGFSGIGVLTPTPAAPLVLPSTTPLWGPGALMVGIHGVRTLWSQRGAGFAFLAGVSTTLPANPQTNAAETVDAFQTRGVDPFWGERAELFVTDFRAYVGIEGLAAGVFHYRCQVDAMLLSIGVLVRERATFDVRAAHGLSPGVILYASQGAGIGDFAVEPFLLYSPALTDSVFVRAGVFIAAFSSLARPESSETVVTQVGYRF